MPTSLTAALPGAPSSSASSPMKTSPAANTHLSTQPVHAKTTEPQGPPLGPRNPTSTDQPTWADKVACKREARAAQRQGHLPQQSDPELAQLKHMYVEQAKEIQFVKELAKQQAPESREGSSISGPVSIRGAKKGQARRSGRRAIRI
ncbi:hypothetical protein MRX96_039034 [Rhipicephalus microplus]